MEPNHINTVAVFHRFVKLASNSMYICLYKDDRALSGALTSFRYDINFGAGLTNIKVEFTTDCIEYPSKQKIIGAEFRLSIDCGKWNVPHIYEVAENMFIVMTNGLLYCVQLSSSPIKLRLPNLLTDS